MVFENTYKFDKISTILLYIEKNCAIIDNGNKGKNENPVAQQSDNKK